MLIYHRVGGGSPTSGTSPTERFAASAGARRPPVAAARRRARSARGAATGAPDGRAHLRRRVRRRPRARMAAPARAPSCPSPSTWPRPRRRDDALGGLDGAGHRCAGAEVGRARRDGRQRAVHRRQPHPRPRPAGAARRGAARPVHGRLIERARATDPRTSPRRGASRCRRWAGAAARFRSGATGEVGRTSPATIPSPPPRAGARQRPAGASSRPSCGAAAARAGLRRRRAVAKRAGERA